MSDDLQTIIQESEPTGDFTVGSPTTETVVVDKPRLSCPECGAKFRFATGLGRHRQTQHGVVGSSTSAKHYHKSGKKHKCPECGMAFNGPHYLGRHRQSKHGVVGKSNSSTKARDARRARGLKKGGMPKSEYYNPTNHRYECPTCDKGFINKASLFGHMNRAHNKNKKESTNGSIAKEVKVSLQDNQTSNSIRGEIVGLTLGRIQEVIRNTARTTGVLATDLASAVYAILPASQGW